MAVSSRRGLASMLSGAAVRIAGFAVIIALLGMFVQMLTVAYPILAANSLTPMTELRSLPDSEAGALLATERGKQSAQVFPVSEAWRLEGQRGQAWYWAHDFSGLRIENTDLPADWNLAGAVGNDRGLAISTGDKVSHFYYLPPIRTAGAPSTLKVGDAEITGALNLLTGHPRLSVVAVVTDLQRLEIIDFRNPEGRLSAELEFTPTSVKWVSASRLKVSTDNAVQFFEFLTTDIGGAWSRLFKPVAYEGYDSPQYLWLPLPAAEEAEPKYSVAPLLFGTLKAAILALIFAIPLSIGAAVYVGFFMSETRRMQIRPVMDLLTAFPTVVLAAIALFWVAPRFEQVLSAVLGVTLLFPPLTVLGVLLLRGAGLRLVRLDALDDWPLQLLPLILTIIATSAAAGVWGTGALPGGSLSAFLASYGFELPYFNSLIVGMVLGLAITPTLFSVAEEAIHSVPRNMASGALALGSTPWQSFRDIVLPLALPGIIAAVMIGFGRAAGETMILLMLSGNTAVIDLSVFEGLRSVSASLALELPEAPRDSSHYHVLFVMGLMLFAVTFAVNTAAEIVKGSVKAKTRGSA